MFTSFSVAVRSEDHTVRDDSIILVYASELYCPSPYQYAWCGIPNDKGTLWLWLDPKSNSKSNSVDLHCVIYSKRKVSLHDESYSSVSSGSCTVRLPKGKKETECQVLCQSVSTQEKVALSIHLTSSDAGSFQCADAEAAKALIREHGGRAKVKFSPPVASLDVWRRAREPKQSMFSHLLTPVTRSDIESCGRVYNRPDVIVSHSLSSFVDASVLAKCQLAPFLRYSTYSYLKPQGNISASSSSSIEASSSSSSVNASKGSVIPVWIQSMIPNCTPDPPLCSDEYLIHAIRNALRLAAVDDEKQFIESPLSFPEVYAQTCAWWTHSLCYASDQDLFGANVDEWSHPGVFAFTGSNGGDCEDTAIAVSDMAARLHYRSRAFFKNKQNKTTPVAAGTDALVVAILKLAAWYIPVVHDCVSSRPSSQHKGKDVHRFSSLVNGKDDGEETTTESERQQSLPPFSIPDHGGLNEWEQMEKTSQSRGLHVICRLYPLPCLIRLFDLDRDKEQLLSSKRFSNHNDDEKGRSERNAARERNKAVIRILDSIVAIAENAFLSNLVTNSLPILCVETTDGFIAVPTDHDPIAMDLNSTLSYAVPFVRVLNSAMAFHVDGFVRIVLRGYSPVLFLDTGIPTLMPFENSNNSSNNNNHHVLLPGMQAFPKNNDSQNKVFDLTAYARAHVYFVVGTPPTDEEITVYRNYQLMRPLPRMLTLSAENEKEKELVPLRSKNGENTIVLSIGDSELVEKAFKEDESLNQSYHVNKVVQVETVGGAMINAFEITRLKQ